MTYIHVYEYQLLFVSWKPAIKERPTRTASTSNCSSTDLCRSDNMKTTLLIVLLALSTSAYAATIPADATKSLAALKSHNLPALKRSYEVIEKLLLGNQSPLTNEEEESVVESLKALTTLKADLDPESEEYFLSILFQKVFAWAIQQGVSKAVSHGVGALINKG
ncbi:uncharacterized protein LOC142570516 [Dermacentor variabilis]|uniref:uncharacterized protein LOC142570516 n=1 Tax=Dermacentor variabilis TaxID=34621 RepID=UPI003F5B9069